MHPIDRREFLKRTGLATGFGVAESIAAGKGRGVVIVLDPDDPIASAVPAKWAAGELQQALAAQGVSAHIQQRLDQAPAGHFSILAAGAARPAAREILRAANTSVPEGPEALALVPWAGTEARPYLACGSDVRGLVYALLELADRARHAAEPLAALEVRTPVVERPANVIRSIARCFESDVEDKPWYYEIGRAHV